MKALVRIVSICLLVGLVVACTPQAAPPTKAPEPAATTAQEPAKPTEAPKPTAEPTLSPNEQWLKAAELGKYAPEKQDWAAIEEAAKKEGKVVVYSNSSRIADLKEPFEKKYPGIILEGYDLGGDDVLQKTLAEQKSGTYVQDVFFCGSNTGEVAADLMPKQYLWKFIPDRLVPVVPQEFADPLLVSRFGVRVLGYNTELNPNGCPVSNFWELTEPEWKGKVFIEDPLTDSSTVAILATIVSHKDDLAQAYKDRYGKDPVLEADTPDAGWLWLKKFAQNKPTGASSGGNVVEAFAALGMKEAGVGFTSYSKYRDTEKGKLCFAPCTTLKPVMGVQTAAYVAIANGAPHPNAAKLFIDFVNTEEGFAPWNVIGNYSPRTDLKSPKGAIPYEELSKFVWTIDEMFAYNQITKVRDFWAINLLQ